MAGEARATTNGQPADTPAAPRSGSIVWLRLSRFTAGVALLGVAWGAIMAAILLAVDLPGALLHRYVFEQIGLYVVSALGVLWLGATALACLIVGAFCLMLALTERGW